MSTKEKVVLAYSGGLDTSVIARWLVEQGYEVICLVVDVGQRDLNPLLHEKAKMAGATKSLVAEVKEEFVRDFVYPAIRWNAKYEGRYYLGTSLARPIIAKELVRVAKEEGARTVAHGATGKGNDQIRFELTAYALMPEVKIIAPWRDVAFRNLIKGRQDAIEYAKKYGIPVKATASQPWSSDENLLHISYEAGMLEDPAQKPRADMFEWTKSPQDAPDKVEAVAIDFEKGIPVAINGQKLGPVALMETLNEIGSRNGVGRVDMVESRHVGMKSRGVYETPAGTILMEAHRDLEGLTTDREVLNLKETLMPRWARNVYFGYWYTHEMESLAALLEHSQRYVTGRVNVELYKGNITCVGRSSEMSLYSDRIASMDDDHGAFDQSDSTGFIRILGLPLRQQAARKKALGEL